MSFCHILLHKFGWVSVVAGATVFVACGSDETNNTFSTGGTSSTGGGAGSMTGGSGASSTAPSGGGASSTAPSGGGALSTAPSGGAGPSGTGAPCNGAQTGDACTTLADVCVGSTGSRTCTCTDKASTDGTANGWVCTAAPSGGIGGATGGGGAGNGTGPLACNGAKTGDACTTDAAVCTGSNGARTCTCTASAWVCSADPSTGAGGATGFAGT